jgi:hypothetical protein
MMIRKSDLTPLSVTPSVRDAEHEQLLREEDELREQAAAHARGVSQATIDRAKAIRLVGERNRATISDVDSAWLDRYLIELEGPRTEPVIAVLDNESALRAWKSARAKLGRED